MTNKFKRSSPSQSPYASNEDNDNSTDDDDYDASTYTASESINSPPPTNKPSIKSRDSNTSPNSTSNSPKHYINIAPLPIFHGNPNECPSLHLSRFTKVCRANNASSINTMMRIFPVTLENEAALWYDLNVEPYPILSWEEIKSSFSDAYKKIELADQLRSELMTINQGSEEMVRSYFLRLQLILKKWPDNELPDGLLRAIFVDGLREDFKEWIIPQKPSSLNEALRLAFGFEQVRSVRTAGRKCCGFCEGEHEEGVCEVRERMRELWKRGMGKESDAAATAAAVGLVRSVSMGDDDKEGGEMVVVGLKKKSQCQCLKHQCGKKKLDRNFSIVSKSSKAD